MASISERTRDAFLRYTTVPRRPEILLLVHQLLAMEEETGWIAAECVDRDFASLSASDGSATNLEMHNLRTYIRLICARLAIIAANNGGGDFLPCGGTIEFRLNDAKGPTRSFRLSHTNTPARQHFRIEWK